MYLRRGEAYLQDKEYRFAMADFRAGADKLQPAIPRRVKD
jgi:hypothetical protein